MRVLSKLLKSSYFYLFLVILLAGFLRTYKIDNPIADWHSWRQADTAAVARNFYKEGFNPFYPRSDDMSKVADHQGANPNRYRFVEFPIYPSLVYFGYLIVGSVDERVARLISIGFSLLTIVFLFLLCKKYFGDMCALIAAFIFAALPFSVYYGRTILPESSLVCFSLGMVYFLDRWIFEKRSWQLVVGLILMSMAFLTKPMAIFYALVLVYSIYKKEGSLRHFSKRFLLLFIGVIPLIFWRLWISQHPEGIPASNWLFNGNGIRFRPAFWYWIIGERLGGVILGAAGFALFIFGLLIKPLEKENWFWHVLAGCMGLYLIVIATGNVQHDYYQYFIVPVLAVFVARAVVLLIGKRLKFIARIVTIPFVLLLFVLTFYLSWQRVQGYYQVNNWAIVRAGQEADKILPKDAVILAPYGGDTAFLYQTNRIGFPVLIDSIDNMKSIYNVSYYVSVAQDADTQHIDAIYKALIKNSEYAIYDLNAPLNN